MPLTKWNQIKSELVEMWRIVADSGQLKIVAAKNAQLEHFLRTELRLEIRVEIFAFRFDQFIGVVTLVGFVDSDPPYRFGRQD